MRDAPVNQLVSLPEGLVSVGDRVPKTIVINSDFLHGDTEICVRTKVSIVIPVYNEHAFIEEVLLRVQAAPLHKEILVIDDGSTDGTRALLQELDKAQAAGKREVPVQNGKARLPLEHVRFLFQEHNRGKGAALRRGFEVATGDIVLVQDADLEYDPKDYDSLLAPIFDGRADVVYGSRFLGGPQRVHYFWHYVGNKFLTLLSDMLTNIKLSDMETLLQGLPPRSPSGHQVEIGPIRFRARVYGQDGQGKLARV